jgi:hypothetical protein
MPRPKRSPPKFEERIAAEKARLETQVAHLPHGAGRTAEEDQTACRRCSHE